VHRAALETTLECRTEAADAQPVGETMESTGARQAREKTSNSVNAAVLSNTAPGTSFDAAHALSNPDYALKHRQVGYGLPCAKCRAYYPSDMHACPICKSQERISATTLTAPPASAVSPQSDAAKQLAEERERLRELKSQIYAAHPAVPAATFRCALDQNHEGTVEPAAICHSCYGVLRQHADRIEAALHMETTDAAKIVYDAVWADTSDPNKTYLNAANALMSELRKRAGIGSAHAASKTAAH